MSNWQHEKRRHLEFAKTRVVQAGEPAVLRASNRKSQPLLKGRLLARGARDGLMWSWAEVFHTMADTVDSTTERCLLG